MHKFRLAVSPDPSSLCEGAGRDYFRHPLNSSFRPGSENHPDVDSIWIAVSIEELISFFPPATLGRLYSKKGTSTALYQWVLVTEAAGYNLYVKLTTEQKRDTCEFITNHGPLVHPSRHGRVFSTGTISCPLNVTLSGLLYMLVVMYVSSKHSV